jgi:hypothetical protein
MKNIRDVCLELFKNEDIKRDIRLVVQPLAAFIYNELYVYIWIICVYHIFIILIILSILYVILFSPIKPGVEYNVHSVYTDADMFK